MKQNYTLYIYKQDRRCKTGERLFSTTVWTGRDQAGMQREVDELHLHHYPRSQFRMVMLDPNSTAMTRLVMTLRADTPACCDPSTETYWSI